MEPGFSSEQPSLAYNSTQNPNDIGYDHSAYQPRPEFLPSTLQGVGMEGSPRSPSFSHHPYSNCNVPRYWPIQQSVPSTSNNQSHLNSQAFFSNDLSQIYNQGNLGEIDNRHVAPIQEHCAAGRGVDRSGPHGASDPLGSSSAVTVDNRSSLFTELQSQSGVQDLYPHATSFLCGQVGSAAQSRLVSQEHSATTQEASRRRASERSKQEKKRKDKDRKSKYRVDGKQAYTRICELLEIDFMPENTRAQRILDVVEGLVEKLEVVDDLRRQLEETEEYVDILKRSWTNAPTGANIGSLPPHQGPFYAG